MCAALCRGRAPVRTPAPGPAERPCTRGQSGTRPGAVSLGGPGRPRKKDAAARRGQPARPCVPGGGGGRGRRRLSPSELVSGRSAGRSPGCGTAGPFSFPDPEPPSLPWKPPRADPPAGAQAAGFRTASSASGTFAKVPAAHAQRRREAAREEAGTTQVGPAGLRRGKRVARLADGAGRGGPAGGAAARRGCGRDGKRRGKRAGEGTGWGPRRWARSGAGTRGTDLASRKLGLRARPTSPPLRAACPPRSPGTALLPAAAAAQQPPSSSTG